MAVDLILGRKIEIAPELAQLIEAKEYEEAKNFIYKHFKLDKPHLNTEFLNHQLPTHIDTQKSLKIKITPKYLEFYKKGLLERQLELNNILTDYSHIKYVGEPLT